MSNNGHPLIVDGTALEELVQKAELPVLVDFYADWCGPCRYMAPALEQLAKDHAGQVIVAKLDTDRHPEAAMRYGIRGIPTLLIFKDGEEVGRQVGAVPASDLELLLANIAA